MEYNIPGVTRMETGKANFSTKPTKQGKAKTHQRERPDMRISLALLAAALMGTSCAERLGGSSGAAAFTRCSGGGGNCGTAAAESTTVDDNGVVEGECAYSDRQGSSIKIRFRELPNGQTYAQANFPVRDAHRELRACREEAARAREDALREHDRMMREHQRLQDAMLRQHQALFNQINAPFANLPVYK
ncbi:uncharacterized protein LOC122246285 isoform X2 [Penaeus japonicus]|uniref:uncharacterized protein LOC122246285 isoform X2 n=1 Tax=Penaeus japonicus TaxID=27405 RepID=UPI001C70D995|nr:uncharacterized protein LOC122246285 isoform X2 [Penaeus japonicus]